jgi:hypothetical protein
VPPIAGAATSVAAFVDRFARGPLDRAVRCRSWADVERTFGGLHAASAASYAAHQFFQNGGGEAWLVRVAAGSARHGPARPGAAQLVGSAAAGTGLHALDAADDLNLLCVPRAAELEASQARAVADAAAALCARRRAVFLLDPPAAAVGASAVSAWAAAHETLRAPHVAVYYPHLLVPDPLDGGRPRAVAPSGTVCGIVARLDAERGVWRAPAGTDAAVRGVAALAHQVDGATEAALTGLAVNCLRAVPGRGTVVWGARTFAGAGGLATDWKYLPVWRLASYLETSLERGLAWTAAEPTAEPLWARVRLDAGAFLDRLFRAGALAGPTARDAYYVRCDAETTPPAEARAGRAHLLVGFAPARPREFLLVRVALAARAVA